MNSEELAASATITAANIQADITMQAAYFNFAAIVIGIFLSWMTALHIQKVARLAETRRNVYLELIESFSEMHTAFHVFINKEEDGNILVEKINKFMLNADKASFVAKTQTKQDIYNFLDFFKEKAEFLNPFIEEYIDSKEKFDHFIRLHESTIAEFNNRRDYFNEIWLQDPDDIKLSKAIKMANESIEVSDKHMESIKSCLSDLNLKKSIVKKYIVEFLDSINDLAIPISHKLRAELGAKTNVKLDYSIHKKNKR